MASRTYTHTNTHILWRNESDYKEPGVHWPAAGARLVNKNSQGLLKKGTVKQSRIKSIAWLLRWLVRTRADISLWPSIMVTDINCKLQPSELVRSRTGIKLRPGAFIRTRTNFQVADSWIGKIIQGLMREQVYTQIFLSCHLVAFLHET